jgi:hypothetical protein
LKNKKNQIPTKKPKPKSQIGIAGAIAFRDEHRKRSCSWDPKGWYLSIESKTKLVGNP